MIHYMGNNNKINYEKNQIEIWNWKHNNWNEKFTEDAPQKIWIGRRINEFEDILMEIIQSED